MAVTELVPIMRVTDLVETVRFYESVLGFVCTAFNEKWNLATLTKDRAGIMIAGFPGQSVQGRPFFTGSFYFRVDTEIDRLWEELNKKTKVCYGIENFEYGMREFAVYDNNGYILQFGQEIK